MGLIQYNFLDLSGNGTIRNAENTLRNIPIQPTNSVSNAPIVTGAIMRDYEKILERRKGQLEQVESRLDVLHDRLMSLQREQKDCEQAQIIIQKVAQLTQEQLKYHISELGTLALAAVFDDPYKLELDFVQRRGQTECDIWFVRDDERIHPLSATGGGAVDVASFALRVSLWSLKAKRTRPILILDEPLKFLSSDYRPRASAMLKNLSEQLKLQIIMITHSDELVECADNVIEVKIKRGISHANQS